jgi:hypothetical protein
VIRCVGERRRIELGRVRVLGMVVGGNRLVLLEWRLGDLSMACLLS